MLAKFVFVALKYKGWVGLNEHELHEKAEPYRYAVREHWKRLKRSDPDLTSTLKPFVKHKWCDTAYFLSHSPPFSESDCEETRQRGGAVLRSIQYRHGRENGFNLPQSAFMQILTV